MSKPARPLIGHNRRRYHNGRLMPREHSGRCFAPLLRRRAQGWDVSWFYGRTSRRSGLDVAAIGHAPTPPTA
jgi:hypothetical protein